MILRGVVSRGKKYLYDKSFVPIDESIWDVLIRKATTTEVRIEGKKIIGMTNERVR